MPRFNAWIKNTVTKVTTLVANDLIPLVSDDPNASKAITTANLAADAAFSSRYAALTADARSLEAHVLQPWLGGVKVVTLINGLPAVGVGTNRKLNGVVDLHGWATANISAIITNFSADAGTVRLRWELGFLPDGAVPADSSNTGVAVLTDAPAQNAVKTVTLGSGVSVSSAPLARASFTRLIDAETGGLGGSGGDFDAAKKLGLVALILRRAS